MNSSYELREFIRWFQILICVLNLSIFEEILYVVMELLGVTKVRAAQC